MKRIHRLSTATTAKTAKLSFRYGKPSDQDCIVRTCLDLKAYSNANTAPLYGAHQLMRLVRSVRNLLGHSTSSHPQETLLNPRALNCLLTRFQLWKSKAIARTIVAIKNRRRKEMRTWLQKSRSGDGGV
jgi:hypothetical protein